LSIGQTIFLNELKASAHTLVPFVPYEAIVSTGAYNLHSLTEGADDGLYILLRRVYMRALHKTYIYPLAIAGVALLATLAIENKNLKQIEEARKAITNNNDSENTNGEKTDKPQEV
jgi:uncharacterized membrane protein YebE (DUF533 family)